MVKKVFIRIWRTFIILVNTVFNLLSTVMAFAALFEGSSYTRQSILDQWMTALVIIIAINILNHFTRKHFANY